MESRRLTYSFQLQEGQVEEFTLEYDIATLELLHRETENLPDWTGLNYHKCPHCSLDASDIPRCPLAVSIAAVVTQFQNILSFDEIYLEVNSEERKVSQKTTAQRALGSFLGVVMAVSGCPHTVYFRPMARFHLPLASEEETIYRSASMYLLAQYFKNRKGGDDNLSLKGLDTIYKNIQLVNTSIVDRLRGASEADSSVNAVILLDMYARVMPYVIEDSLEDIEYLFTPYMDG